MIDNLSTQFLEKDSRHQQWITQQSLPSHFFAKVINQQPTENIFFIIERGSIRLEIAKDYDNDYPSCYQALQQFLKEKLQIESDICNNQLVFSGDNAFVIAIVMLDLHWGHTYLNTRFLQLANTAEQIQPNDTSNFKIYHSTFEKILQTKEKNLLQQQQTLSNLAQLIDLKPTTILKNTDKNKSNNLIDKIHDVMKNITHLIEAINQHINPYIEKNNSLSYEYTKKAQKIIELDQLEVNKQYKKTVKSHSKGKPNFTKAAKNTNPIALRDLLPPTSFTTADYNKIPFTSYASGVQQKQSLQETKPLTLLTNDINRLHEIVKAITEERRQMLTIIERFDNIRNESNITNFKIDMDIDLSETEKLCHRFNFEESPIIAAMDDQTLDPATRKDVIKQLAKQKKYNTNQDNLSIIKYLDSYDKRTVLDHAIINNDVDCVTLLINCGAKVNLTSDVASPLFNAAKTGNFEITYLLLLNGADVYYQNQKHQTPLHVTQDPRIAKLLMINGAKTNIEDNQGQLPLDHLKEQCEPLQQNLKAIDKNIRLEKLTPLKDQLSKSLSNTHGKTQIKQIKQALIDLMNKSTPETGLLLLEPKTIGQCLELINTLPKNKIKTFFNTPGPGGFSLFYYIQRALESSPFDYNPRHYANIRQLLVGIPYLKPGNTLPNADIMIPLLKNNFVTFSVQDLLLKCACYHQGFHQKFATFLIDTCGATLDKHFFEKAISIINPNDAMTLAAFELYIHRSGQELEHIQQTITKSLETIELLVYRKKHLIALELINRNIAIANKTDNAINSNNNNNNIEEQPIQNTFNQCINEGVTEYKKIVWKFFAPDKFNTLTADEKAEILLQRRHETIENNKNLNPKKQLSDNLEIETYIKSDALDEDTKLALIEKAKSLDKKYGEDLESYMSKHANTYKP